MTTYAMRGPGIFDVTNMTSDADVFVEGYPLGRASGADIHPFEDAARTIGWAVHEGGWIEVDGKRVDGPASGTCTPTP